MENSKASSAGEGKPTAATAVNEENSNSVNTVTVSAPVQQPTASDVVLVNETGNISRQTSTARTPFTDLSQVDADLALARTLQEQERAYMMLSMNADGSDYGSWESDNYMLGDEDDDDFDDPSEEHGSGSDDEEDASDVLANADEGDDNGVELDPSAFASDEAYARALQDAEDREIAARLLALAGFNDLLAGEQEVNDDHDGNIQEAWDEVDPDQLSYEELLALGEVVGTESRGLSADRIASLPSITYKTENSKDGSCDSCVICRLDYEDDDALTVLSCKHSYHAECINNWLQINKVCPVCNAEVPTSGNS
jgi:E3 ubiquitin-protein ligase BIG BROTHER-like protein